MKNNNVVGRGYFRKSKAYGLVCGVVLATAFFGVHVSADEVTSSEPISIATEQGANQTIVAPENDKLSDAIQNATNSGVDVTQDANQSVGNKAEANNDYNHQAEELDKITAEQDKINQENAQINKDNQSLEDSQQNANQAAQNTNQNADKYHEQHGGTVTDTTVDYGDGTSTDDYHKGQQEAEKIDKENDEAVTNYLDEKAKYEAVVEQANALNNAVSKAENDLTSKGVTVIKVNKVVHTLEELKQLLAQNEAAIASANKQVTLQLAIMKAYNDANDAYQNLNQQVSDAVTNHGGSITVDKVEINTGQTESDYQDYKATVENLIAQNQQKLQEFLQKLEEFKTSTKVNVSTSVATQNVDNLTYGDSFMSGVINADGTFTFTHDMNDGDNSVAGILGTGTLTGKLNYTTVANGDGSITVTLSSIDLYSYQYTSNRLNHAVNQNLNFHVYTIDGVEIYSNLHNGNNSFTDVINRNILLNKIYTIAAGASTGNIGVLTIDDNWIYNTHGQAIVNFTNPNQLPTATLHSVEAPVNPPVVEVQAELVKASNPDKPELVLQKVNEAPDPQKTPLKNNLRASYHLNEYKVTLTTVKDVLNDNGISINNGTLQKGETGHYILEGAKVEAHGKDNLVKYDFEDYLDVQHDEYKGYHIYAMVPITLKDGTVIKSGADLQAYAQAIYDSITGRFYVTLNSDFLAQIAKESDFQAKIDIEFVRFAAGDVYNDFVNHLAFKDDEGSVTDVPVPSNEVVTHTPESEVPETPETSETPVEDVPVVQSSVLPLTGDETTPLNIIVSLIGVLMFVFGILGVRKRKED